MPKTKCDALQGALDLMILKTLESMGPLHGYGIACGIEQVSSDTFTVNQGTIYPALLRLEQRKWIRSDWGTSDTGRRAKFYSFTRIGQKQLAPEEENWSRIVSPTTRFLSPAE
jgi:transcriptional regulator